MLLMGVILSVASCQNSSSVTNSMDDHSGPLPITHIAQGAYAPEGFRMHGERVFRTADEWQTVRIANAEHEPDFETESVIVAAINANTGGYSVAIDSVFFSDGEVKVDYTVRRPGGNCMVTQALTNPFHAVAVPALPEDAEIHFNQQQVTYQCPE